MSRSIRQRGSGDPFPPQLLIDLAGPYTPRSHATHARSPASTPRRASCAGRRPPLRRGVGRRGELQRVADRLDPVVIAVRVDVTDHFLDSAVELRPEESRSRLQDLIRPAQLEVLPLQLGDPLLLRPRRPRPSTAIDLLLEHPPASLSRCTPICPATSSSPPSLGPRPARHSNTRRTARSRNSSGYRLAVPWTPSFLHRNGASMDSGAVQPAPNEASALRPRAGVSGQSEPMPSAAIMGRDASEMA